MGTRVLINGTWYYHFPEAASLRISFSSVNQERHDAIAYINQLSHYACDLNPRVAPAYTFEHLLTHPTWPTEWKQHRSMSAWMDWMYTGNTDALAQAYATLANQKLLMDIRRLRRAARTPEASPTSGGSCGPTSIGPAAEPRQGLVFTRREHRRERFLLPQLQHDGRHRRRRRGRPPTPRSTPARRGRDRRLQPEVSTSATTGLYVDGEGRPTRRCTPTCFRWRSAWFRPTGGARPPSSSHAAWPAASTARSTFWRPCSPPVRPTPPSRCSPRARLGAGTT